MGAQTPQKTVHQKPQGARPPSLLRDLGFLLLKIAVIALALLVLFTYMYGLHRTGEPSMNPALKDGDLIMYYRLNKQYVAGDVVMLTYNGEVQARRVVAMQGDVVDITEDGLLVNGALQQEQNIYQPTQRYEQGITFPVTVGEGQVFLLADAREGATDSRVYGPVDVKDTHGRVITLLRRRGI